MDRNAYEIGGFAFSDQETMDKAAKEAEGIRYMKSRIDMENPDMVLQVYCQMIDQGVFETPVGHTFLHELQEYLIAIPHIRNEDIPAIPAAAVQKAPLPEKRTKVEREVKPTVSKPVTQKKVQNIDFKSRFHFSFFVNIILLLIVVGMFVVAMTSGNINIINYENAIIEKYEHWEDELNEREDKLRERERELNNQTPIEGAEDDYIVEN